MATNRRHAGSDDRLRAWAALEPAAVLAALETGVDGLSAAEAARRLVAHGPNTVAEHERVSAVARLLRAAANPLAGLLAVLAGLSFVGGDRAAGAIMLLLLSIGIGLRFVQEARADAAVEALRQMIRIHATVVRAGVAAGLLGSSVSSGTGLAVVVATGLETLLGRIAAALEPPEEPTAFDRGLERFTWTMVGLVAVMVPLVFLVNGLAKGDWVTAALFALAVGVGLAPEMLPMIVAVCLSRGALAMAERRVIVKHLDSIQNLGAMDVLCTDKTGTLTLDRIILERHCDLRLREAPQVLELAWLNSHFQTGLKSVMDRAILDRQRAAGMAPAAGFEKLDEIPFDFGRRVISVVVRPPAAGPLLVCKGAVDAVHARCGFFELDGVVRPIDHDEPLAAAAARATVMARLAPADKERIVRLLRRRGHVVGFLGDGINDAPALRAADVGITVDTAADIARESADCILLEKDLRVLGDGVREGRKVFVNILKYARMGAASNFGNVLSMLGASIALPFLPMAPLQVLAMNVLYDCSQVPIPGDAVDPEAVCQPRPWSLGQIVPFVLLMGPVSSLFDFTTFATLWWLFQWNDPAAAAAFHTGWFVESLVSQTLVIHVIRTARIPCLESRASPALTATTLAVAALGIWLAQSPAGRPLGFVPLPVAYWPFLALTVAAYLTVSYGVQAVLVRRRWIA